MIPSIIRIIGIIRLEKLCIHPKNRSAFIIIPIAVKTIPSVFSDLVNKKIIPAIKKKEPMLIKFVAYGIFCNTPVLLKRKFSPKTINIRPYERRSFEFFAIIL